MIPYGKQLLEQGFLRYADEADLGELSAALVADFDIYDAANNKIVQIDAEELAEFSFDYFMPQLTSALALRDFQLYVEPDASYETTNIAFINGCPIQLYTNEELNNGKCWASGPANFFRELNRQLSAQKIEETVYLLYGGNDLHALLLTAEQYKIIASRYKNNAKEIPNLP